MTMQIFGIQVHQSVVVWLGFCCLVFMTGCDFQPARTPDIYLIPAGYVGWVDITLGDSSASPLPKEGNAWLIQVPPNGKTATSTKFEEGWATDHFFYVSGSRRTELFYTGWGQGGLIWREEDEFGDPKVVKHRFFVGTETQLNLSLEHFKKSIEGKWPWPAYEPPAGPMNFEPNQSGSKP